MAFSPSNRRKWAPRYAKTAVHTARPSPEHRESEKPSLPKPVPPLLHLLIPAWLRLLRPAQWIKNGVVLAAYLFAWWDPSQSANARGWGAVGKILLAAISFCLASSAVYILNDLHDVQSDKSHPLKKLRPLASGEIGKGLALIYCALCAVFAGVLSCIFLPKLYSAVIGGYLLLQLAYTFCLKKFSYIDVFVISCGFVLRALAGAVALDVRISPWLLLCTFLLSLFLALCKRRHEKVLLDENANRHREALDGYDVRLLDLQIGIAASATLVSYALYTLSAETVARFNTSRLGFTIPIVVFGLFRYLELVYRHDEGGRPEKVLLTDRVMICTFFAYLATVLLVFATL